MDANTSLLNSLAQRCREETSKYYRRDNHDPQFCFELLRQALFEQTPDALAHIYHIYTPQVLSWVRSHSQFHLTGETPDYFATLALRNFYFALAGPKFLRFHSLGAVLSFLKACVFSAVQQYVRDHVKSGPDVVPIVHDQDIPHYDDPLARIAAAELWTYVMEQFASADERLLLRCYFILDMKPREIVQAHPHIWRDENQIRVMLQRIKRQLYRDARLRAWLTGSDD